MIHTLALVLGYGLLVLIVFCALWIGWCVWRRLLERCGCLPDQSVREWILDRLESPITGATARHLQGQADQESNRTE